MILSRFLKENAVLVVHNHPTDNCGLDIKSNERKSVNLIKALEPKSTLDLILGEGRGNRSIK